MCVAGVEMPFGCWAMELMVVRGDGRRPPPPQPLIAAMGRPQPHSRLPEQLGPCPNPISVPGLGLCRQRPRNWTPWPLKPLWELREGPVLRPRGQQINKQLLSRPLSCLVSGVKTDH